MPERDSVIKALENADATNGVIKMSNQFRDVLVALLKEQEAVIRCKDCKHATMTSDGKMCKYCAMDTDDFGDQRNVYHDADWFCADGKPKTADEILMEKWDADLLG